MNRELGWAAGSGEPGVQSRPFQSVRWAGGGSDRPSHHTSPSSVSATLVKMLLPRSVAIALAFVTSLVPVRPRRSRPGIDGIEPPVAAESHPRDIVADGLYLPARDGRLEHSKIGLPACGGEGRRQVFESPLGGVTLRMSMCSASHPSSRAITDLRDSALSAVYGREILRVLLTWGFVACLADDGASRAHPAGAGRRRARSSGPAAGYAGFPRAEGEERPGSGRLRVTTPCNRQELERSSPCRICRGTTG